ncbi:unnamed protein product [Merluccius merluccius]
MTWRWKVVAGWDSARLSGSDARQTCPVRGPVSSRGRRSSAPIATATPPSARQPPAHNRHRDLRPFTANTWLASALRSPDFLIVVASDVSPNGV